MTATSSGRVDDGSRSQRPVEESDQARRRIRPRPVAITAGAVAVTAAAAVLGFAIADPGDKPKPGTAARPTQAGTSSQVTIGAPPNYKVQRCTQWSGTARLPASRALVLGVRNIDNGDPRTYFATVTSWSGATGQGDWSRPLYFGDAGSIRQQYAVTPMTVKQSAVDAVPNKDGPTTWAAEHPRPTSTVVKTVYVKRRGGRCDC
jgi:hypothetical protein